MLSSMHNDLIGEFESYGTAQDMWIALKAKFGGTTVTRLRALTLKFNTFKIQRGDSMQEHLRKMLAMVCELKAAGNNLTDEQQIQAVIRSLPDLWEQMKLNMTHNESIQTLEDLSRHLELEAERRVAQGQSSAFFAKHGQRQAFKAKRKSYEKAPQQGQNGGKPPKRANTTKSPRGKQGGRKQAEQACFDCGVVGHFAHDCT
jgi:phage pi2 protein 07